MDKQELRDQLIEQIKQAFANVPYPGDGSLYGNDETRELIGKHWNDVPIEMLAVQSRLLHLTPKALRFYLPAYLIGIISNPVGMDVLVDDIVHFLSPSTKLAWKTETIPYLPSFEASESSAIRAFFESYQELFPGGGWSVYEPTRAALERAIAYWQYYSQD